LEDSTTDEGLKRVIGIPGFAASIVNNTLGGGIYVLPAIVAMQMGAVGILAYLFCGIMLITIMLCYAEVGSKINTSGGSYVYVETAFGPFAGFVLNWLFFFGYGVLSSAAVLNIMASSLALLFPVFAKPLMQDGLYFVLLSVIVFINVRGAKQGESFLKYITLIKLLPLLGIIVFGFAYVKTGNLHWQHFPSFKTSGETTLVLFYAFMGFETSFGVSGEIKNPKRTIPLGILSAALVIFIFYGLIQTITQGVLGAQMGQFKSAPLAAIAQHIIGPIGATILIVAAIVSCLGNTSGDVMATPRLLFAGAKDGIFPKLLAKVHPKFATPYAAIITYAVLLFIFAASGGFRQLAVLSSGCLLLIYLSVVLAMLKLRTTPQPAAEKSFKIPGGYLIPAIAIAAIVWLLFSLKREEVISIAIFLVAIVVIYWLMKLFQKRKGNTP
jgi:APA family basic amino acid/polyamine antiporter